MVILKHVARSSLYIFLTFVVHFGTTAYAHDTILCSEFLTANSTSTETNPTEDYNSLPVIKTTHYSNFDFYPNFKYDQFNKILFLSDGGKAGQSIQSRKNPSQLIISSDFKFSTGVNILVDNNKLPFNNNSFDLILMNRGLCPCRGLAACGGIDINRKSMKSFLTSVVNLLNKNNPNSLALITGFYFPGPLRKLVPELWMSLVLELQPRYPLLQFAILDDNSLNAPLADGFVGIAISAVSDVPIKKHIQLLNQNLVAPIDPANPQLTLWYLKESGQIEKAYQLEKQLEDSLKNSSITSASDPLPGKSGALIVTLEDGTMGVWKPALVRNNKNHGSHELAAYLIDQKLGLNVVPIVVKRSYNGQEGTLQLFVKNAEMQNLKKYPDSLSAFDYLLAHRDRHERNYFTVNGRQIAIDHGEAFFSADWEKFMKNVPGEIEDKVDAYLQQIRTTLNLEKSLVALSNSNAVDIYRDRKIQYETNQLKKSNAAEKLLSAKAKNSISALLINRKAYFNLKMIPNSEWENLLQNLISEDDIQYFLRRKDSLVQAVDFAVSAFGTDVIPAGPFSPVIRMQELPPDDEEN
jgi:hypothetical protein